jgi:hypothetical protein
MNAVTDPTLLALVEAMQARVNVKEARKAEVALKVRNAHAMRTIDYNGLTCKAEGCFDKADFYGSNTHFCESHMLIQVGA